MTKKPAPLLPKSMAVLREAGYLVEKVERWNAFSRTKNDLFGIGDLVALGDDEVVLVQVTSAAHHANRRTKIADHENTGRIRKAGVRILLHSWAKRDGRWALREEDLS